MSIKSTSSRTSYAWQHRAELPGKEAALDQIRGSASSFEPARDPVHARALADQGKTEAARRGSHMVKSDRPYPAPRPSPSLALGADRAAFNTRWQREAEAAKQQAETPERAARREAFKAMRRHKQALARHRPISRTTDS
ncbi:hypothetical protein [Oceanibaculum indicum]|uniref:Uncharacterized protein n=1 Tax=Oceanibaculum indicum P24 TaxID=1207063 RepID=K2J0W0_9PROT|nr:hypothetical protein [Oceanibaculum indicum]EKE68462.1 hypothetical protein P24_17568 [Oceanibaculum indicum P24]